MPERSGVDDDHYLEAQPDRNARGSPVAPDGKQCGDVMVAGYSAVLGCVLARGREGSHESITSAWGP